MLNKEGIPSVEDCRGLIVQEAMKAWRRLSPHTRVWISPEDLILDGICLMRTRVKHDWCPRKGVKFTTYLYTRLRFFYDYNYVEKYTAKQRWEGTTQSIEEVMSQRQRQQEAHSVEMERALGLELAVFDPLVACHITSVFPNLYREASLILRKQLVKWFFQPGGHIQTKGGLFDRTSEEFRVIAKRLEIDIYDCRHLVSSPVCLDEVSREVLGLPYSLAYPTPGLDRQMIWPVRSR
jgi:hypothetical protein